MTLTSWIILGSIVVLILWLISVYNGLVALRQRVGQAFSDVDVQLKQRHDLVPNLVETVKGYAAHERGTLEAVIAARNTALTAQGPGAQAVAENQLTGGCSRWQRATPTLKPTATSSSSKLSSPISKTKWRRPGGSSTMRCKSTTPASSSFPRLCSPARSVSCRESSSKLGRTARPLKWPRKSSSKPA
jgi:LemA family